MRLHNWINHYQQLGLSTQHYLLPPLLLLCRVWVAWVFFNAGLLKITTWDSTLYLFEFEYQVPLIPWQFAAYLGTLVELVVPVFIVIGFLTRPMAIILFVFNAIAVISYPVLWEQGFDDHLLWGLMLLNLALCGSGWLSVDSYMKQRLLISTKE